MRRPARDLASGKRRDQRGETDEVEVGRQLKQNLMGIGGLRPHIRSVPRPSARHKSPRRPQLCPPSWGRFFWGHSQIQKDRQTRPNRQGS
jgi:hypothetical protein